MGALIAVAGIGIPLYAVMDSRLPRIAGLAVVVAWLFVLVVVWFRPRNNGRQGVARLLQSPDPWVMAIALDFFFVVCVAWLIKWAAAE
jgi:hypothetical protein